MPTTARQAQGLMTAAHLITHPDIAHLQDAFSVSVYLDRINICVADDNLDTLRALATVVGADITEHLSGAGQLHHNADGTFLLYPVYAYLVEPAPAAVPS